MLYNFNIREINIYLMSNYLYNKFETISLIRCKIYKIKLR